MNRNHNLRRIGEIAGQSGVTTYALRYYEKEGLLGKPQRTDKGYRLYPEDTVQKLRFLRKAQELGLTLTEIKKIMISSKEGLKPCCNLVRVLFEKKINEFDAKIKELQRMKRELEKHLAEWIPAGEAKRKAFAVCPQIEKGGKKNGKAKS